MYYTTEHGESTFSSSVSELLDDYGFTKPSYTIDLTTEDGASRYVMVKDSKTAYKVSQDVVSNMITVSQEDAKE